MNLSEFLRAMKMNTDDPAFDSDFYENGQIVFRLGNTPHGLYYIKSGKVKIYKHGSDGKEQILKIAGAESFMGYKDLLAHRRYTASASVVEDAVIVFIPKEDFFELFKSDSHTRDYFTELLCLDLVAAEEKMVAMAYKPVRGRLAETLLTLSETYRDGGQEIGLSREDLAHLVGTAKETVIRLLSEFKAEKLVKIRGKYISVLNPAGLVKVENLYR